MANDSYIPIPKDLTVAVVCSDRDLLDGFKQVLARILITMVEDFEHGEDAIKRFQIRNFDMLYILGNPTDFGRIRHLLPRRFDRDRAADFAFGVFRDVGCNAVDRAVR